jgi:hypothetical protein
VEGRIILQSDVTFELANTWFYKNMNFTIYIKVVNV